jgi:hypothetical protein
MLVALASKVSLLCQKPEIFGKHARTVSIEFVLNLARPADISIILNDNSGLGLKSKPP